MYALPSPINKKNMIRQHTLIPPTARFPDKHDQQAFHCHTDNFGKLLRGSVTDPMLITGFDSYFTSRSPGAWV